MSRAAQALQALQSMGWDVVGRAHLDRSLSLVGCIAAAAFRGRPDQGREIVSHIHDALDGMWHWVTLLGVHHRADNDVTAQIPVRLFVDFLLNDLTEMGVRQHPRTLTGRVLSQFRMGLPTNAFPECAQR